MIKNWAWRIEFQGTVNLFLRGTIPVVCLLDEDSECVSLCRGMIAFWVMPPCFSKYPLTGLIDDKKALLPSGWGLVLVDWVLRGKAAVWPMNGVSYKLLSSWRSPRHIIDYFAKKSVIRSMRQLQPLIYCPIKFSQVLPSFKGAVVLTQSKTNLY